ncbi:hypothetical protein BDV93DRAFT_527256 [Ceratobasidium sp. AG-I]|nr:hypothetical protein BDV93DRAFT_527256 [Ceratobasidium sp. AG-I]
MPRAYLISKYLDPILGIATGVLAYHLHETNPRTAPPEGQDLRSLIRWKRSAARQRELDDLAQWNETMRQMNLSDSQNDTTLPS